MNDLSSTILSCMADRTVVGASPARFSYCKEGGRLIPLEGGIYSYLFVLKGSLTLRDNHHEEQILGSGTVTVVSRLASCTCSVSSLIVEFIPPQRINRFFRSTFIAFSVPCSERILLVEPIFQWIGRLWNDCYQGTLIDTFRYCRELRILLQDCMDVRLGTLAVPLQACSLNTDGCTKCQSLVTTNQ